MFKIRLHPLPFLLAAGLLLARPALAIDGMQGHLVGAKWLEQHLKDPDVLVIDTSPGPLYAAKHIPGAVYIDPFAMRTFGLQEMSNAEIEQIYQAAGIQAGKKIVVYDPGGSYLATRLFFSLLYHGFPAKDVFVLDGGLSKWEQAGLPVTKEVVAPTKGTFKLGKFNEELRVRLPEVLAASGERGRGALVDASEADTFYGQMRMFPKPGHIPQAVSLPSSEFFNTDKTFKSPEELRKMAAYWSISPEQPVYPHCGGGVAATVPFFAFKYILQYPQVRLFNESQMGWLNDDRDLPYWTYAAPYLLRETGWLQSWGGKMMRSWGVSPVSIVDVRPAAAYSNGHLPFALNVPAEVFRKHLASPAKLAEILGAAGVNPAHEAVVVAEAGLTKDAALAFLALEKLGQQKVSIFTDAVDSLEAMDKLAQRGFGITKAPTAVGPRKSPQDLTIPPVAYTAQPRQGMLITDAKRSPGVYPKVFIASGKAAPATTAATPEGKVVHLPYTDLLNADGTPKPAKDIQSIAAKAGVPKYAELVFIADDVGEAAVNYFVFKLMGYPDIKVLASAQPG